MKSSNAKKIYSSYVPSLNFNFYSNSFNDTKQISLKLWKIEDYYRDITVNTVNTPVKILRKAY